MKKEEIKGMIERLEKATEGLARYCHAEDCEDIWDCPLNHEKCSRKIGLDTSIAWEMAERFKYAYEILQRDPPWPRDVIREILLITRFISGVVARHKIGFPKLWEPLCDGWRALVWFYYGLKEEGAWEK